MRSWKRWQPALSRRQASLLTNRRAGYSSVSCYPGISLRPGERPAGPPRDEKALAAALARLLDNPLLWTQFGGKRATQTVMEKFKIEQNFRLVYDVVVSIGGPSHVNQ